MEQMMKAAVYYGKNDIRVEERPVPEIGDDDVLLKSRLVSVCGSDLQPYVQGCGGVPGEVFGHEFAAEIAAVGKNVKGYSVGERVFGHNMAVCGECWYCTHGDYSHCANVLKSYTGKHLQHPGALAQYFVFTSPQEPIPEAPYINSLMKIPDEMTDEQCALMEPFGVGVGVIEKCGVKADDIVVILGAGMIGNCAMQWAHSIGARVAIADISKERLEMAKACGADWCINSAEEDCYAAAAAIAGEIGWTKGTEATTARVVVDCAGYPGSLNDALRIVRAGGTVCEMADNKNLSPVNITYITYKDVNIIHGGECDVLKAQRGLLDGSLKTEPLISETVTLDRIRYAFEEQAAGKKMKVLVRMDG
jgi:L-iditol 2-dehydrogenase